PHRFPARPALADAPRRDAHSWVAHLYRIVTSGQDSRWGGNSMTSRRALRSVKLARRAQVAVGAALLLSTFGAVAVAGTLGEGNKVAPIEAAATPSDAPSAEARAHQELTAEVEHAHGGVTEEDVAASAAELAHSTYAAASKDELQDLRREARKKLIQEAI